MNDLGISKIIPNGDCGWLIHFAESSNRLAVIHALTVDLLEKPLPNMINVIPATDSLVVIFATPVDIDSDLIDEIKQRIQHLKINHHAIRTHEIPVCYDPGVATDVMPVCEALSMSHQQLLAHHTKPVYRVDMLGFLPGFAYLSGNHSALNIPRKDTPALLVKPGSVAIADKQTGIYSLSSPGGWHVIGRTPMALIDWQYVNRPMVLNPLDEVRFKSIDVIEYQALIASHCDSGVDDD